jgi:hypothetical protein
MAKVIFEFDDIDESYDVLLCANRRKLLCALNEVSGILNMIVNGRTCADVWFEVEGEGKEKKYTLVPDGESETATEFLKAAWVERELDVALSDIWHILNACE